MYKKSSVIAVIIAAVLLVSAGIYGASVVSAVVSNRLDGYSTAAARMVTPFDADAKADADADASETPESSTRATSARETTTETVTQAAPAPAPRNAEPDPNSAEAPPSGPNAVLRMAGLNPKTPSCNGDAVLILGSALDPGDGHRAAAELPPLLAMAPGTVFYTPGACPSLRTGVDGMDVYAVVLEFGSDVTAMCSTAASYPGSNPRLLNGDTSYSSPC